MKRKLPPSHNMATSLHIFTSKLYNVALYDWDSAFYFQHFSVCIWLVYNSTSFNRTPSSAILIMSLAIKYNNNDIEWEIDS